MTRFLPVLVLMLLAPMISEALLGNLPLTKPVTLVSFPVLALLYGTGAVLVREVARRRGRGYPAVFLLALAYGLVEEGLVVQTLFNGGFLGLDLHSYGELPALGMGLPWTLYVLTIHSVWSIAVPIALVEALFPGRDPWLRAPGTVAIGLVYLFAAVALAAGNAYTEEFFASAAQLAGTAVAVGLTIVLALVLPRRERPPAPPVAVRPGVVGVSTFITGSAFFVLYWLGLVERIISPTANVAATILVVVATLTLLVRLGRTSGWGGRHVFAAAAGATLVYAWVGFLVASNLDQYESTIALVAAQGTVVLVALGVLVLASRRVAVPASAG